MVQKPTRQNPALQYLRQIRKLDFTNERWTKEKLIQTRDFLSPWSHNIRLPFGVYTAGCEAYYPTHRELMSVLNQQLGGSFRSRRVIDIGCLDGYFSIECALQGASVVGVDGRDINVKKCEFVASALKLKRAEFRKDDATRVTTGRYGTFDVALALGLLYHLEDPHKFLKLMRELVTDCLVLETIVATEEEPQVFGNGWQPELTPLGEIELGGRVYRGKRFREYPEGTNDTTRDLSATAALRNDWAVWLTRDSLVQMLKDVGFEQVQEVLYGPRENIWWRSHARVLMLAIPERRPFQSRMFE